MRMTSYEVESFVEGLLSYYGNEYDLPDDWYGDSYLPILEDCYGGNLKTELELEPDPERQYAIKQEIEIEIRSAAEAWDPWEIEYNTKSELLLKYMGGKEISGRR